MIQYLLALFLFSSDHKDIKNKDLQHLFEREISPNLLNPHYDPHQDEDRRVRRTLPLVIEIEVIDDAPVPTDGEEHE